MYTEKGLQLVFQKSVEQILPPKGPYIMVETVQDTIREPIEIVDRPEETIDGKRFNMWLLVPVVLAAAVGIFFVVSRILSREA
jgi:hypothetical protein